MKWKEKWRRGGEPLNAAARVGAAGAPRCISQTALVLWKWGLNTGCFVEPSRIPSPYRDIIVPREWVAHARLRRAGEVRQVVRDRRAAWLEDRVGGVRATRKHVGRQPGYGRMTNRADPGANPRGRSLEVLQTCSGTGNPNRRRNSSIFVTSLYPCRTAAW
jgi:hypothetical protein